MSLVPVSRLETGLVEAQHQVQKFDFLLKGMIRASLACFSGLSISINFDPGFAKALDEIGVICHHALLS